MRFSFDDLRALIYEALINAYSVLGLEKNATEDEIKRAYRTKALEFHPDRNAGKDTTAAMVQVNVAKDILSDPQKRRRLDVELSGPSPSYNRPAPPGPGDPRWWGERARQAAYDSAQRATSNQSRKRYFVNTRDGNKFWWIQQDDMTVTVGWGRVGRTGQTKQKTFRSFYHAAKWVEDMVWKKVSRGYKRTETPNPGQQQSPPPRGQTSPGQQPRRQTSPQSKSSYKIYGRNKGSPLHTRIKGRAFMPTGASKFHVGDKASISFDDKDNIKVKNDDTGHTQSWKGESFDRLIDDMLIEVLFKM